MRRRLARAPVKFASHDRFSRVGAQSQTQTQLSASVSSVCACSAYRAPFSTCGRARHVSCHAAAERCSSIAPGAGGRSTRARRRSATCWPPRQRVTRRPSDRRPWRSAAARGAASTDQAAETARPLRRRVRLAAGRPPKPHRMWTPGRTAHVGRARRRCGAAAPRRARPAVSARTCGGLLAELAAGGCGPPPPCPGAKSVAAGQQRSPGGARRLCARARRRGRNDSVCRAARRRETRAGGVAAEGRINTNLVSPVVVRKAHVRPRHRAPRRRPGATRPRHQERV